MPGLPLWLALRPVRFVVVGTGRQRSNLGDTCKLLHCQLIRYTVTGVSSEWGVNERHCQMLTSPACAPSPSGAPCFFMNSTGSIAPVEDRSLLVWTSKCRCGPDE